MNPYSSRPGRKLAVLSALPLLLASSLAAQERVPVQQAQPGQRTAIPAVKKDPVVGGTGLSAPTLIEVPALPDTQERPDIPFELTRDPMIQKIEGVDSGTAPVPAYLKGNPYRLSFIGGDYTPKAGQKIDPELAKGRVRKGPIAGQTYGFVMFEGRITETKMKRVEGYGVKLINFHTFQSYTAVIPYRSLLSLQADPAVRWVGYARHQQKLDPEVMAARARGGLGSMDLLVTLFDEDQALHPTKRLLSEPASHRSGQGIDGEAWSTLPGGPLQRALEKQGAEIRGYLAEMKLFFVHIPTSKLDRLADLDFVHYIELDGRMEAHHDRSTKMIGADRLRGSSFSNGKGSVMGIIDTGAWVRNSANPKGHKDLAKWTWGWDFLGGGVLNDTVGHGTHVLGTMMGTGSVNNRYRGLAIGAGTSAKERVFVAKAIPGSTSKSISAIGNFRSSVTSGGSTTPRPTVVNGSFGSPFSNFGYTGTDSSSIAVDKSVYSYGQTYVLSAGNSGFIYGFDRWNSVTKPGVSKNAMTVASLYDFKGQAFLSRNTSLFPGTSHRPIAKSEFAAEIVPSLSTHMIYVSGFKLKVRGDRAMTLKTRLYDSFNNKPGKLLRTSTMTINKTTAWRTTTFSSPYHMATNGRRFYISIETPSTGVVYPWSNTGSKTNYYFRSAGATSWSSRAGSREWIYSVIAETQSGEVTETSSKGPTKDGRMKPNIGAPGRYVTSTLTKTEGSYTTKSGTSMAAPHVSGVVAMFQQRNSSWKYRPYATKSMLAATANPIGNRINTSTNLATQKPRNNYLRAGLGCVDAYKATYSNNLSTGWVIGTRWSTQTSSSGGFVFNLTIPADADRVMLALNFDEQAPSTGASRACLADYDLYLDYPPYSSAVNAGDYSSRRAWDTWEWLNIYGSTAMARLRGKTVRIKAWPRVKPGSGRLARVGISYCMYRGSNPSTSKITIVAPDVVKPNQLFRLRATIEPLSGVSTNTLLEMYDTGGFSRLNTYFRSGDNLLRINGGLLDWTLGNVYPKQSSLQRNLEWSLRKSLSGNSTVRVRAWTNSIAIGDVVGANTASKTICVDGTPPPASLGMRSTTHALGVWSNKTSLGMRWNTVTDSGCAGVAAQAVKVASPNGVTPTSFTLSPTVTTATVTVSSNAKAWYFTHRSKDRAGNLSNVRQSGPYFIDTSKPNVLSVSINNGAATTSNLNAQVRITASDTFSGVQSMRFSSNGVTWTPFRNFSTGSQSFNLATFGGNTAQGTKRVFAEVRDRAGNLSSLRSDTILYQVLPKVTSSTGTTYTVIHDNTVTLIGTGFSTVDRVLVGARLIQSKNPDDWNDGWFKVLSNTKMEVHPPQNFAPGTYPCVVRNGSISSNAVSLKVVLNTTARTGVPPTQKSGRVLHVYTARGPRPATTLSILTFSISGKPLVIPGLISLGHGGNTTTFIDPSFTILSPGQLHNATTRTAHWAFPTPAGKLVGKFYWASLMFDAANPTATPIPASTTDVVLFSK